jgi:hypothetical protein
MTIPFGTTTEAFAPNFIPSQPVAEYEFTAEENGLLEQVARRLRVLRVGWSTWLAMQFAMACYVLVVSHSVASLSVSFFFAVPVLIMTSYCNTAEKSLHAIATTTGSDIQHLITAMGRISDLFFAQSFGMVFTLVVTALQFLYLIAH